MQAGLTFPSDAGGTGLKTHRNVSTSFKIRRKKLNFYLEENALIYNIKIFILISTQS